MEYLHAKIHRYATLIGNIRGGIEDGAGGAGEKAASANTYIMRRIGSEYIGLM